MANIPLKSIKFPDLVDTYTVPSNAGELPYNKSATYPADTVGKALQNIGDSSAPAIIETATGSIASFTDGANVPVKDLVAEIVPLQSGSGDPSPDNVRAISGWNECNVSVCGKNLLDCTQVQSAYSMSRSDETFTNTNTDTRANLLLRFYVRNGSENLDMYTFPDISIGAKSRTFTITKPVDNIIIKHDGSARDLGVVIKCNLPAGTYTLSFDLLGNAIGTVGGFSFKNIQVELGSTATTHEPYNGEVHAISFASAGTVYGGRLDVTSGVLTVTKEMVDLGDLGWTYYPTLFNGSFGASVPDMKQNTAESICSKYKSISSDLGSYDDAIYTKNNGNSLYVRDTSYTDASAFKSANIGTELVYDLATPQTYQLTPTEVKTLLKSNNIWADTGDVTVEYVADTKTFIENLVNA